MQELLIELADRGIRLEANGEQLRIKAPPGAMDDALRERLKQNKQALIVLLRAGRNAQESEPDVAPDVAGRHTPFALTEIQHAYWMGRIGRMETGGMATQQYFEFDGEFDPGRLEVALQKVIARHDMLRAVIGVDGMQRILPEVSLYCIDIHDLSQHTVQQREDMLLALRSRISGAELPLDAWPMFAVEAVRLGGGRWRLLLKVDMMIIDESSLGILFAEWQRFYEDPAWNPPALNLSYRDYAQYEHALPDRPAFQRAKDYWQDRIETLPGAPQLPVQGLDRIEGERVVRRSARLRQHEWEDLKRRAQANGATASVALAAALAAVLRAWSKEPEFTINLTMFSRSPIHPEVERLIGDFTSTNLLAVQGSAADSFAVLCKRMHAQLTQDLVHREYSGTRVLRDRARGAGVAPGGAAMPVVFTSTLGLSAQEEAPSDSDQAFPGAFVHGIVQTPQVWIASFVKEVRGELLFAWDCVEALFPRGVLDDMFAAYEALLQRLSREDEAWTQQRGGVALPAWQQQLLTELADTRAHIPEKTLHGLAAEQARRTPDAVAVITPRAQLTYRELHAHAYRLAQRLRALNVQPNTLVAVTMERGWEQVAAVLGILHAGAAYLPIDPALPEQRRWHLAERGEVKVVVTQAHLRESQAWPQGIELVVLDDAAPPCPAACTEHHDEESVSDLAYVIFTSGSTGEPKGVMIDHRGAANTVQDINRRVALTAADRVLALSALNFDLSVWDIFGPLSAGGAIVMPAPAGAADPAHWSELVECHAVSVWNSAPALMQLWVGHLEAQAPRGAGAHSLRQVMLSGDWIPVTLPERIRALLPAAACLSLGGATEASIWSIAYPIDQVNPEWTSIPYGKALANQTMHVFDAHLQPCPAWTVGRIYIGGVGLALGYWRDEARTAERFIVHPQTGERLYHTGDLGRLLPDGDIEFLGRDDFQVKINGYRIELGEIAAQLRRLPGIREAIVTAAEDPRSGQKLLVAYLLAHEGAHEDLEKDVKAGAVGSALAQVLPAYMAPRHFMAMQALPLSANGKVDLNALPLPWNMATTADGDRTKLAPRTPTEERLTDLWAGVLGHREFGVDSGFFEAGGDSVIAIQLAGQVRQTFGLSAPMQQQLLQQLFRQPSVAALGRFLDEQAQTQTAHDQGPWSPLVLLGGTGNEALSRPFFCVHAIDGKTFCLQNLAHEWGEPFYGLQAAGLSGEQAALQRTEDMAALYLAAIRRQQAQGPYRLGGYSSGGMVVFEMARRLEAEGETIELLVMIDSPAPVNLPPSHVDETQLLWWFLADYFGDLGIDVQAGQAQGGALPASLEEALPWLHSHGLQHALAADYMQPLFAVFRGVFHSSLHYHPVAPIAADILMIRAGKGHMNEQFGDEFAHPHADLPDLGWGQFTQGQVVVQTVPGDHYSMMFAGNAINVAAAIRGYIDGARSCTSTPGQAARSA